MKRNKQIAAVAAACLALSSISVPVFAESSGSYTEVLRELSKESVSSLEESYREIYDKLGNGFAVEETTELTLGESTAVLAQTMGLDISWLDNIKITNNTEGLDDKISGDAVITLNDGEIASLSALYDLGSQTVYAAIPEIFEQNFSVDLNKALELAAASAKDAAAQVEEYGEDEFGEYLDEEEITEGTESAVALLSILTRFHSLKEIQAGIPSPEIVSGVYYKYLDMVLNHLTDAGSEEVVFNVNGITQEGTSYSATMGAEETIGLAKDLLLGMKNSVLVKWLYTSYLADAVGMSYDDFAASLGEAAEEIESTDPSELGEGYEVASTVTFDADGNVIGQTSKSNINGEDFVVDFKTANDGSQSAVQVVIDVPESMSEGELSSIVISGTADLDAEGAATGDYDVIVDDQKVAVIHADNARFDKETGFCSGSLTLSLDVPEDTEDYELMLLGSFNLKIDYDINDTAAECALTVAMSGADLATLRYTVAEKEAPAAIEKSAEDFEPAVDALDQEALQGAAQNFNLNGIMQNLVNAGMPEDFIQNVVNLFSGSGASSDDESEDFVSVPAA